MTPTVTVGEGPTSGVPSSEVITSRAAHVERTSSCSPARRSGWATRSDQTTAQPSPAGTISNRPVYSHAGPPPSPTVASKTTSAPVPSTTTSLTARSTFVASRPCHHSARNWPAASVRAYDDTVAQSEALHAARKPSAASAGDAAGGTATVVGGANEVVAASAVVVDDGSPPSRSASVMKTMASTRPMTPIFTTKASAPNRRVGSPGGRRRRGVTIVHFLCRHHGAGRELRADFTRRVGRCRARAAG